MPQSLSHIIVHLVFSTKHRESLIADDVREALHSYMAGVFQGIDSPALLINSMPDHVHVLFMLSRKLSLADVLEEIKTKTSKWMKARDSRFADFYWQNGYGAFSVSQSNVKGVRKYISNQEEHHRTRTFQEEFLLLCKRHGVPYDERYMWD